LAFWFILHETLLAEGQSLRGARMQRSNIAPTEKLYVGRLVTGFIGMRVARQLLVNGHDVVWLDNLNACYGLAPR
jgi:hypothetical protein